MTACDEQRLIADARRAIHGEEDPDEYRATAVVGMVAAVVMPVIGFVVGIVLVCKPRAARLGAAVLLTSFGSLLLWANLLAG